MPATDDSGSQRRRGAGGRPARRSASSRRRSWSRPSAASSRSTRSTSTRRENEIVGAHRPQRRRQDDALQRDHRRLSAHLGLDPLQGARHRRHAALQGHQAGHRAHVPEHPPVQRDDGARERDGRPALPLAHEHRCASSRALPGRCARRRRSATSSLDLLDYVGLGGHASGTRQEPALRLAAAPRDRAGAGDRAGPCSSSTSRRRA